MSNTEYVLIVICSVLCFFVFVLLGYVFWLDLRYGSKCIKTKKDYLADISRSIGSLSNNLDKVVTFNTRYINYLNILLKEDKSND